METTGKAPDELENQETTKKSNVLLIEGEKKDETSDGKISPDERFFLDEDDVKEKSNDEGDEKEKSDKVFGKQFKKDIKAENRKRKIAFAKKRFTNIFGLSLISGLFRFMDFALNVFSIAAIIFGVLFTAKFFMEGNPYMVVSGCVFIFIVIYLNEKIS